MQKTRSILFGVLIGLFAVLSTGRLAQAQMDQGTILGLVQDTTGAVISNAEVTLKNIDTNFEINTKSNEVGIYVFPPVKIGTYTVSASAPGFEKIEQQNIVLHVSARVTVNMTLRPGAAAETVMVTGAPPPLQTQGNALGQVFTTDVINSIPLNGRNWVYAIQLSAGVTGSTGTKGSGSGDFSANGQRAEQNNFMIDGIDNNISIMDEMNGSSYSVRPPPDALAEFKVDTSSYSAEFGRSAGAVVNVSVKAGTNQIHGSVWEYFRNTSLSAMNWNAKSVAPYHQNQFGATLGMPIIKNKLFFFGDFEANRVGYAGVGTYSVPTPRMLNGDFSELLDINNTTATGPIKLYTPNTGGYALQTCNGNQNVLCSGQINSVAQNILKLYPHPNANGWTSTNNTDPSMSGKVYNNYVINRPTTSNVAQWDMRLDWNISPKDQAFARLSYSNTKGFSPGPLGPILDGNTSYSAGKLSSLAESMAVSETHIFSPTLFNEVRFGYNYGMYSFLQAGYNSSIAGSLGLGGIPTGPMNGGLPQVSVGGITAFGSPNYDPSVEGQNVYQILENLTKVHRSHSFKFGVNFQSMRTSALQPVKSRGNYSFNGYFTGALGATNTGYGVADFLLDQMASASVTNITTINDVGWYRAAYAQDDWKITPSLTLNLGIRYDYFQPSREHAGNQANFAVTSYGVTSDRSAGTGTGLLLIPSKSRNYPFSSAITSMLTANNIALKYVDNMSLVNAQKANVAPRIGFAYTMNPRTVVSGGYGIFYGGVEPVGVGPNMGQNFPFTASASSSRGTCTKSPDGIKLTCLPVPQTLEKGFSDALAVGLYNYVSQPSMQGAALDQKVSNTMSYNLSVQRAFTASTIATVSYVGNVSRHLIVNYGSTTAVALSGTGSSSTKYSPFPGLGGGTIMQNGGMSNYNGLQAKLDKRYTHGFGYLASFTYAHVLDDSYDPIGGGVNTRNLNIIPMSMEYTNSPYDIRRRIAFTGFYALPFGKGRRFLNHNGLLDAVVGGWSSALTFSAQTGKPFSVSPSITTATGGTARAIKTGNPFKAGGSPDPTNPTITCPTAIHTKDHWYNACAFANPLPQSSVPTTGISDTATALQFLGGRANVVRGPGYQRLNMSMSKSFAVWREKALEVRAESFNLPNTPSYSIGNSGMGPTAGQITGYQSVQSNTPDARFFQLSAKIKF